MRIESLLLERYGHFTGRELDFSSPNVRLHVVLGPNEAGKTTALHAVGDLLFGIDPRSPFDFLHGYKDMRIGGEISAASGETLTFKRRKRNKNTLLDGEGGEPGVRDAIGGGFGFAGEAGEDRPVAFAGGEDHAVGLLEEGVGKGDGFVDGAGFPEDARVGGEADKGAQDVR